MTRHPYKQLSKSSLSLTAGQVRGEAFLCWAYTYDKINRLTGVTRDDGSSITYGYDGRNNRITMNATGEGFEGPLKNISYAYNEWDEMISSTQDGLTTEYEYDLAGKRITKRTGDDTTHYAYNSNYKVIAESNEAGDVTANYIWSGERLLAKHDAEADKDYYFVYNGHGDVVQILDQSTGAIVNSYQYDEWGNILDQTEGIANDFLYAGEIQDEETGLYYLRARYYDPVDGRFTTKDSIEGKLTNPSSLNSYIYVWNNPLIFVDTTGNAPKWLQDAWQATVQFGSNVWDGTKQVAVAVWDSGLVDVYNFAIGDDINTLFFDPNASFGDKALVVGLTIFPAGKVSKVVGKTYKLSKNLPVPSKVKKFDYSSWGDKSKLDDHFNRHGSDLGAKSKEEYTRMANSFYKNRNSYKTKTDRNGQIRVYDRINGIFGSYNSNGTTATYFKPKPLPGDNRWKDQGFSSYADWYWNNQPGK
jgi:RHS repeat-associated protein